MCPPRTSARSPGFAGGSVIFGKTDLPPYCLDAQSFNEVFGCTKNP